MTVNLIHTAIVTEEAEGESLSNRNWAKINQVSEDGNVFLADETVNAVAILLDGVHLTNGEKISSFPCDDPEDEFSMKAFVYSFGPALLGEDTLRQVRTTLEQDANGEQAVALFDLIVELGLQINLSGKDFIDAHMHAVNWPADTVEINTTESSMSQMFAMLGLEGYNQDAHSDNVPLDIFEKAVNDNAVMMNMAGRLQTFVACAKRNGSTHVYWA